MKDNVKDDILYLRVAVDRQPSLLLFPNVENQGVRDRE